MRAQATGRRLYQSDLEAVGGGSGEEIRRNFAGLRSLSEPEQPVLAWRSALRLLEFWNADIAAARQDRDPL